MRVLALLLTLPRGDVRLLLRCGDAISAASGLSIRRDDVRDAAAEAAAEEESTLALLRGVAFTAADAEEEEAVRPCTEACRRAAKPLPSAADRALPNRDDNAEADADAAGALLLSLALLRREDGGGATDALSSSSFTSDVARLLRGVLAALKGLDCTVEAVDRCCCWAFAAARADARPLPTRTVIPCLLLLLLEAGEEAALNGTAPADAGRALRGVAVEADDVSMPTMPGRISAPPLADDEEDDAGGRPLTSRAAAAAARMRAVRSPCLPKALPLLVDSALAAPVAALGTVLRAADRALGAPASADEGDRKADARRLAAGEELTAPAPLLLLLLFPPLPASPVLLLLDVVAVRPDASVLEVSLPALLELTLLRALLGRLVLGALSATDEAAARCCACCWRASAMAAARLPAAPPVPIGEDEDRSPPLRAELGAGAVEALRRGVEVAAAAAA